MNPENARPQVAETALALVFFCTSALALVSCGQNATVDEGGSKTKSAPVEEARDPAEQRQRERRAAEIYQKAQRIPPDEKVVVLSDLAQVYHDTSTGPLAFRDLVFYLCDHSVDDLDEAQRMLALFERRRPESGEILVAAKVLNAIATRKAKAATDAAERKKYEEMAAEGLAAYVRAADTQVAADVPSEDVGTWFEVGTAYQMGGRLEDAERAWARAESLPELPDPSRRVDLFIRRAELLRSSLGKKKEALELFLKARELMREIPASGTEQHRQYVEEAIRDLRG